MTLSAQCTTRSRQPASEGEREKKTRLSSPPIKISGSLSQFSLSPTGADSIFHACLQKVEVRAWPNKREEGNGGWWWSVISGPFLLISGHACTSCPDEEEHLVLAPETEISIIFSLKRTNRRLASRFSPSSFGPSRNCCLPPPLLHRRTLWVGRPALASAA